MTNTCNSQLLGNHVARLPRGSATWEISRPLSAYNVYGLVADDRGRVGALVSNTAGQVFMYTQAALGQPYVASPVAPTTSYPTGFSADAAGNVTVSTQEGSQPNTSIRAFESTLAGTAWKDDGALSGSEQTPFSPVLAVSPGGSAVLTWAYGPRRGLKYTVVASTRPSAQAYWTTPVNLSAIGSVDGGPASAAAAAGVGNASVAYSGYNQSQTNTMN